MNTISYNFAKQIFSNLRLWSTFRSQSTQCYSFYVVNIMCRVGYILCSSISAFWNSSCICCSTEKLKHYFSQKLKLVLLIASLFISQYLCKFLEIPPNLLECWNSVYLEWNSFFFPFETLSLLFNHFIQFSRSFLAFIRKNCFCILYQHTTYIQIVCTFPSPSILICILWFPKFLWKILIFK